MLCKVSQSLATCRLNNKQRSKYFNEQHGDLLVQGATSVRILSVGLVRQSMAWRSERVSDFSRIVFVFVSIFIFSLRLDEK